MLVSVCVFVREQTGTMSWRRYADTWTWPMAFFKKVRKKEEMKNRMKERKRKERHLIRAAAPALSFEERRSFRRICIAQVKI